MRRADRLVSNYRDTLQKHIGFVADESKPLWENINHAMGGMTLQEFIHRPSNMACHNYLTDSPLPVGTRDLLGLGLNYCITTSTLSTTTKTFTRLRQDIRRKYHLAQATPKPNQYGPDYIPGLYIKSDYEFKAAPKDMEKALDSFEAAVSAAQQQLSRRQKIQVNLSYSQRHLLQYLRRHGRYIVVEADKNLGPCILDRSFYIRRGCSEHLGNKRNYKIISKTKATTTMKHLHIQFRNWMTTYYWDQYHDRNNKNPDAEPFDGPMGITDAEGTFLLRAIDRNPDKLARFRMSAKIHKIPMKFRPIVSCCGTFMNDWSRWLDYQLQRIKPFLPTYIKDSTQVLLELKQLILQPNARIWTADANSMYNNIDTANAIEVIGWWLDELAPLVDGDFPLEAIKAAMVIIMTNNIFEWGTLHFLQLLGTAMGTSAAVMWATLYFGYHEEKTLIPKYGTHMLYFKRFIDDIIGIWLIDDTSAWDDFKKDVNDFDILTWEIGNLGMSVDFLDLTLTINGESIDSCTFQKAMNLYLYLHHCPHTHVTS